MERNDEHVIRRPASVALGLATVEELGIHDEDAIGVPRKELLQTALRLIRGVASVHKANGGAWGDHWQSSLWASLVGRAAWLLWDRLDKETQEMACRLAVHEADRHLQEGYRVPYWNGRSGDSKAEENSWEAQICVLAAVLLPSHPHAPRWRQIASELMASAYARPSDRERTARTYDGQTPRRWLRGYNLREDGIVINHGLIHNDYLTSIAHGQMAAFLICSLAEVPVPETAAFNFEVVYRALITKTFPSPPYEPPGGTMYIPGRPEQYYPQGTDWSRLRFACFYLLDTYAYVLDSAPEVRQKARDWMRVRAARMLDMQARHPDGRLYEKGEFDRYSGAEQFVLWMISDAYLLLWLHNRGAVSRQGNWLDDQGRRDPKKGGNR